MDRRSVILSSIALLVAATRTHAGGVLPPMHVARDPNCGCCKHWLAIMEKAGFSVTAEDMYGNDAYDYALANGIPGDLMGCHTARVAGYTVEGHVPAADILRLLEEKPDAIGLAVPGMPFGSPGMGPETEREAYDVYLVKRDGSADIFTSYPAA